MKAQIPYPAVNMTNATASIIKTNLNSSIFQEKFNLIPNGTLHHKNQILFL